MDLRVGVARSGNAGETTAEYDMIAAADRELAGKIAAGDPDAWDRFFDRYSRWVYRFAYSHLDGNKADAEDLCSDIMMTAARSIRGFDSSRGGLDVWMHGIARHRLAHFCRGRRIHLPLVPDLDCSCSEVDSPNLDALLEKALMRDIVKRTLAALPERQASVLIGKYVEGFSTEELARISETTPKAVESLLVRARSAFRSAFSRLLNEPGGEVSGRE